MPFLCLILLTQAWGQESSDEDIRGSDRTTQPLDGDTQLLLFHRLGLIGDRQ
jgi:hypothetical protein